MDSFRPAFFPHPAPNYTEDLFVPAREDQMLVRATSNGMALCRGWPRGLDPARASLGGPPRFVGWLSDRPCHAVELAPCKRGPLAQQAPPGYAFREVRGLHGLLTDGEYQCVTTAAEVLYWERTFRRCPRCGKELGESGEEWSKRCAPCGLAIEPRVQPTVLGLFHDGLHILLVQPRGFPRDVFTLPATVVGPGLSLEQALGHFLQRTLGLEIRPQGLEYFGSQPWPYPDRLIIAMHGPLAAGDLTVDSHAFTAARWAHVDDLPALPPPLSMARRLADWYAQLPRVNGLPTLPKR